ncbi:hypothetical protein HN51_020977 [Arachis hypogaea]|uniref:RING-type domain-containing protein n=1 Tax=Arachis hypogaea TaxID=3818 RepID=A0A445EIH7_ARAHY|nr:E3 ubiquitin-protein ligase RHA1B [Arachis hypogaea]RYR75250.1 hypothetical protein Ahy_A02g009916 isoform B [Arachis hypogaea]
MGFPVGYTEVFFPHLFLRLLTFLGLLRNLVFHLFRLLGLSELLIDTTTDNNNNYYNHNPNPNRTPSAVDRTPSLSAILIREFLPVVTFREILASDDVASPQLTGSCAVCLTELVMEDEIRWLRNCKHVFHRECVDRWIDHDQKTCPLCRTSFVPDEMVDQYNQRLWAASGVSEFYVDYTSL